MCQRGFSVKSTPEIIIFIGDFHIGNKNYDGKLLKKHLKEIYMLRNTKIVLMGDYCEFINERSFKYATQTMSPMKQWKEFKRLFKDFAETGQIIACLKGNHEDRYFNKVDGLAEWCEQWDIPYNGRHILLKHAGKYIYAHHPKTSATTPAGRDRVFKKMRDVQDADIYMTGHFHTLYQDKAQKYTKGGKLRTMYFGCTGSYLDWRNSYAEEKLYTPSELGCKQVIIEGKKIEMRDFI